MSAWEIYWVFNFHVIGAIVGMSGVCLLFCAGGLAVWAHDDAPSEDRALHYRRAKIATIFGVILFAIWIAWPTQKTYIAMYFGPKLVGYMSTSEISDEAKECLHLIKRVLLQMDETE